jgi:hypothetical protein
MKHVKMTEHEPCRHKYSQDSMPTYASNRFCTAEPPIRTCNKHPRITEIHACIRMSLTSTLFVSTSARRHPDCGDMLILRLHMHMSYMRTHVSYIHTQWVSYVHTPVSYVHTHIYVSSSAQLLSIIFHPLFTAADEQLCTFRPCNSVQTRCKTHQALFTKDTFWLGRCAATAPLANGR